MILGTFGNGERKRKSRIQTVLRISVQEDDQGTIPTRSHSATPAGAGLLHYDEPPSTPIAQTRSFHAAPSTSYFDSKQRPPRVTSIPIIVHRSGARSNDTVGVIMMTIPSHPISTKTSGLFRYSHLNKVGNVRHAFRAHSITLPSLPKYNIHEARNLMRFIFDQSVGLSQMKSIRCQG